MNLKETFEKANPTGFYVDASDKNGIEQYLRKAKFIKNGELIETTSVPGAGNMNLVLRVTTNQRSFILKQARPWVEKYPTIAAPAHRSQVEAQFYQQIQNSTDLQNMMPDLLYEDPESCILLFQDLGDTTDFTEIYNGTPMSRTELRKLTDYLQGLHQTSVQDTITNIEMRKLNHEHIFIIPFLEDNGLDLDQFTPRLKTVAEEITDEALRNAAQELGALYLSTGDTLLHGDYYPGSWLKNDEQLFIIDPEFGFHGSKEFDLGVFIAHLIISSQPQKDISYVVEKYAKNINIDHEKVIGFAGIEILRRLLGVAQLPLTLDLMGKKRMMERAKEMVLRPNQNHFK
ncbi:MAG: phosphotransferase [Bacteroidota bacterium]